MTGADTRNHPHLLFIKPATRHLFRGQWLTVAEIAAQTGIKPKTIYKRLSLGREPDQTEPSAKPQLYLFRGREMSVREIATLLGVGTTTVYNRRCGNRVLEEGELNSPGFQPDPPVTARLIKFGSETLTLSALARKLSIPRNTLNFRLNNGWAMERIISEPSYISSRGRHTRNRRVIERITIGFRRIRNHQIIHRISSAFQSHTGGYVQTFQRSLGTGVGRHAHDLHQNSENRT